MRILILSQYFSPEIGAPQARLDSFIDELIVRGHRVEVVTSMPSYPTSRIFQEYRGYFYKCENRNGVKIHRCWAYPAVGAGLKRILNYTSFLVTCLVGLWAAEDYDFLFVESPPLFLYLPTMIIGLIRSRPYIFNVADLWPDSMTELGLLKNRLLIKWLQYIEDRAYSNAMFINAITNGIIDRLAVDKGVPRKKILFLPNGVDVKTFRPVKYDTALAKQMDLEGKKVILYAGTHGYAHNLDIALRAAKLLEDDDIHFLFIGNGSEKERLLRYARFLGLTKVKFIPGVKPDELVRYYSIAAAGLSTLRGAPLFEATRPVKVLSIMAMGKPVIYSGRGEGAELVEKANAGVVVPPEDDKALAQAIKRIVTDGGKADKYGENGRVFVCKNLSWPAVVDNWLRSFEMANNDIQKDALKEKQ